MSKISIIIPCYNVEYYLSQTLDSILSQTFKDFEAICVNDGSTDGTLSILESYQKKDARIRIISQANQGQSIARNNALKQITGDYVCFLDSDDTFDIDVLEKLHQTAEENDADMVMFPIRYYSKDKSSQDDFPEISIKNFEDKIKILPNGSACNKIYKTSFLREHHLDFPQGLVWEDNLFTIKACYFSNTLYTIQGTYYNYTCNPKSITQDDTQIHKRHQDSLCIARKIMDFAHTVHCSTKEQKTLSDFCLRNFIKYQDLSDKSYQSALEKIIYKTARYQKMKRKLFKHQIRCFFKKLLHLK